ncbi:hypothetical protein [Bowmanella denitrificans]|uniref:hypothetical protein n=1 Tax=Bowmanella denitrificans TaxID=366582 RepID=UPI000C9B12D3|nr:hypothetical protein [Bowmanella denitrificans]
MKFKYFGKSSVIAALVIFSASSGAKAAEGYFWSGSAWNELDAQYKAIQAAPRPLQNGVYCWQMFTSTWYCAGTFAE